MLPPVLNLVAETSVTHGGGCCNYHLGYSQALIHPANRLSLCSTPTADWFWLTRVVLSEHQVYEQSGIGRTGARLFRDVAGVGSHNPPHRYTVMK